MYQKTTNGIEVIVKPSFLNDQSNPDAHYFVWVYHVKITNQSSKPARLLSRFWRIIDALGQTKEVRGSGVVGEQPRLQEGESFQYSSGVPLTTASGIMSGYYEMEKDDGEGFLVAIPAFSLDSPYEKASLN